MAHQGPSKLSWIRQSPSEINRILKAITGIQARAYRHCHTGIVTQARPHGYGLRHDSCEQDSGSTLRQTLTQAGSVRIRQDDQSQTESAIAK